MNKTLLEKYFNDRCTAEELEQVLAWFQTADGIAFLKTDINQREEQFAGAMKPKNYPPIASREIFNRVLRHRKRTQRRNRMFASVASILILAAALSLLLYWTGVVSPNSSQKHPLSYITYSTSAGVQQVVELSDRIKVWLDENTTLRVPKHLQKNTTVTLKGEAYFQVRHDPAHPFIVKANGAVIKDLGTKFNVRTDTAAGNVRVAVLRGKVMLKAAGRGRQPRVTLTQDHFGELNLRNDQITIEEGGVKNYLSWKTNKLIFNGEPLDQISRQLERLYNVNIQFDSNRLKKVKLTARLDRSKLKTVLSIIASTLDIHFRMKNNQVTWMK